MIENKSLGSKIFDVLNVVFLVIVMLICIMPVWYVLCVSLSSKMCIRDRNWELSKDGLPLNRINPLV